MRLLWCLGVLALVPALLSAGTAAASQPRVLLITGLGTADPDHPKHILSHRFYNERLVDILQDIAQVSVTEDLSTLSRETLKPFDIILNNSFLLEPTPAQFEAFFEFIEQGKGYIALHAGLESFVNSDRYVRMMGGRLAGHYGLRKMAVETYEDGFGTERTTPASHPIASGIDSFETHDELYVVQTNTDELQVIARSEAHPIAWSRPWGNGSVIALTLGHAEESLQNEGYQALLRNSVKWLTGYPLLEPLRTRVFTTDAGSVEDVIGLKDVTHVRGNVAVSFRVTNDHPEIVSAVLDENDNLDLRFAPGRAGTAVVHVMAESGAGKTGVSRLEITVKERGAGNLAAFHGVSAHTSSNEPRYSTADPSLVIDGDLATRWSSKYLDPSWIYLDLGSRYAIERVRLAWEPAYASRYEVQVSSDAREWKTVATRAGRGGTEEIRLRPTEGRYVRMFGTQRATRYGYSLYEFQVFGTPVQ